MRPRAAQGAARPPGAGCRRKAARIGARARARHGNTAGFTLFELVLVIVLLGTATLPLVTQFVETGRHAADGQSAASAVLLARERLEEAAADRDAPGRGYAWITTANYPAESPVAGFPGYTRTTAVSGDSTYDSVTYKVVTVTVIPPTGPAVTAATWVVSG